MKRRKQHFRAMSKPVVKRALSKLKKNLIQMDRVQVGQQLLRLRSSGCSVRGLADELNLSAATIQRHIQIAKLSEDSQNLIKAGRSAKQQLAIASVRARRARESQMIAEERRSGAASTGAAKLMLTAVLEMPGILAYPEEEFFGELRRQSDAHQVKYVDFPKVSRRLKDPKKIIRDCTPSEPDDLPFNDVVRLLLNIAFTQTPTRQSGRKALEKFQQILRQHRKDNEPSSQQRSQENIRAIAQRSVPKRIEIPSRRRRYTREEIKAVMRKSKSWGREPPFVVTGKLR